MKIILTFLLALAVAQALIPKNIEIPEDQLYPKKSLKEWEELLSKVEYVPSNEPKTDGIPQPESSGKALTPRIVGGSRASSGQFPWQVAVHMDSSYFCGGSLISANWVLTAGHCVDGVRSFAVNAGTLSPNSGGQSLSSTSKILHSGYNSNTIQNDIGLIRFSGSFSIGSATINSVLLPSSSIGNLVGQSARISGWGKTSDSSSIASALQYTDLPIVSSSTCLNIYGAFTEKQICASTSNGRSTCNGDSGGPLVIQSSNGRWTEVGIVSFGSSAGCQQGYPVGFTRVSSYLSWISSNTGLSL